MNKIIRFTWDEWKWIVIIVMLGVNMYWTALLIQPTHDLLIQNQVVLNETREQTEKATVNVQRIIETMNNNTNTLQRLIEGQAAINDNQVILVRELGNMSQDLGAKSQSIDQNSKVLVLQSAGIQNLLDWSAGNFSEADKFNRQWEKDDRMRSHAIQGNLSEMARTLQLLELIAENNQIKGIAAFNTTVNVTQ